MKRLFLLALLFSLMLCKVSAQVMFMWGSRKEALKHIGEYVEVVDNVTGIKIINPSRVYLRIRKDVNDRGIIIILTGKGADKKALLLKRHNTTFTGRLRLVKNEITIVISDFNKIGNHSDPGCNCQAGDPNTDVNIDTLKH